MLVLDLEIKKAILGKGEAPLTDISYCKGWGDHAGMGISVMVVYDYVEQRYRIFMDDNKDEFKDLIDSGRKVIGFNQINFDNRVLKACWDIDIPEDRNYDLLKACWAAVSKRENTRKNMHKGYGLNALCEANLGIEKSDNGAFAPHWWQQGKVGKVIDYCMQDVKMTKEFFDLVLTASSIMDPVDNSKRLIVAKPEWAIGE